MEIINPLVAYLDAFILISLACIYPLRKFAFKKRYPDSHPIVRLEAFLRRNHKKIGILLIVVTILHAKLTHQMSIIGMILFIVSILIGLTYCLKRVMKCHWLTLHRWLTVLALVLLVAHIFIWL